MVDTPANRLREARQARGFGSAREAAIKFGWSVPTYTSHENGTRGLRIEAARRYAAAFRVSVAHLMGLGQTLATDGISIRGSAAIGIWRDSSVVPFIQAASVRVPDLGAQRDARIAVEIADDSCNRAFNRGDYAICEPIDRPSWPALAGRLVYIERKRDKLVEASIRRVDASGVRLTPYSTDQLFASGHDVPVSDPTIISVCLVVGRYIPFSS